MQLLGRFCACMVLYQSDVKLVKINFLKQNQYVFDLQNQFKSKKFTFVASALEN